MAAPVISAPELVKAVDAAAKAAEAGDQSRTLDSLNFLAKQQVTTQLLLDTQAGKKVRKLFKHSNAEVGKAATDVVATWKKAVKKEQSSGIKRQSSGSQAAPSSQPDDDMQRQPSIGTPTSAAAALHRFPSLGNVSESAARSSVQAVAPCPAGPPLQVPKSGNPARDKTRQLMAEALAAALSDVEGGDPGAVAAEVESAMFQQANGFNPKYKAKLRSLLFNLKDARNPDLRRRVLTREVSGEELISLPPEALASDQRRQENQEIREHALWEAERSQNRVATTDQFQCGKCKQRKCTYFQMQTRSADEPMTTFVTCMNCENRWKFS